MGLVHQLERKRDRHAGLRTQPFGSPLPREQGSLPTLVFCALSICPAVRDLASRPVITECGGQPPPRCSKNMPIAREAIGKARFAKTQNVYQSPPWHDLRFFHRHLHHSAAAAKGTEFQLPAVARDLSTVYGQARADEIFGSARERRKATAISRRTRG